MIWSLRSVLCDLRESILGQLAVEARENGHARFGRSIMHVPALILPSTALRSAASNSLCL